jgi:hypothetical protein
VRVWEGVMRWYRGLVDVSMRTREWKRRTRAKSNSEVIEQELLLLLCPSRFSFFHLSHTGATTTRHDPDTLLHALFPLTMLFLALSSILLAASGVAAQSTTSSASVSGTATSSAAVAASTAAIPSCALTCTLSSLAVRPLPHPTLSVERVS